MRIASQTVEEEPERAKPPLATSGAQEGAQLSRANEEQARTILELEAPAESPSEGGSPEPVEAQEAVGTSHPSSISAAVNKYGPPVLALIGAVLGVAGGFIFSVLSAVSGDQWATIVSAAITVLGSLGAAVLTVYLTRLWQNR